MKQSGHLKGTFFGNSAARTTRCCDVTWISKFPHECEVLFARGAVRWEMKKMGDRHYRVAFRQSRIRELVSSTFCRLAYDDNPSAPEVGNATVERCVWRVWKIQQMSLGRHLVHSLNRPKA